MGREPRQELVPGSLVADEGAAVLHQVAVRQPQPVPQVKAVHPLPQVIDAPRLPVQEEQDELPACRRQPHLGGQGGGEGLVQQRPTARPLPRREQQPLVSPLVARVGGEEGVFQAGRTVLAAEGEPEGGLVPRLLHPQADGQRKGGRPFPFDEGDVGGDLAARPEVGEQVVGGDGQGEDG